MKVFGKLLVLIVIVFCFSGINAIAQQRKTVYDDQSWFQYFLNARLSEKWSLYADGGYRTSQWLDKSAQYLLRGGATYHFNKTQNIQGGAAYFVAYVRSGENVLQNPEIRLWQRFNTSSTLGKFAVIQRYRLEERFVHKNKGTELVDGYNFNFRVSYHLGFQVALNKPKIEKGAVYLQASNELFINFGGNIVYNIFDQERIFAGVGYQVTEQLGLLTGYQHVWQQRSDGVTINEVSCLRLSILHNIDFRTKE